MCAPIFELFTWEVMFKNEVLFQLWHLYVFLKNYNVYIAIILSSSKRIKKCISRDKERQELRFLYFLLNRYIFLGR